MKPLLRKSCGSNRGLPINLQVSPLCSSGKWPCNASCIFQAKTTGDPTMNAVCSTNCISNVPVLLDYSETPSHFSILYDLPPSSD
ncbi:hypothetical protein VULLAG_LOCUS2672 [Vulpes lagopus]